MASAFLVSGIRAPVGSVFRSESFRCTRSLATGSPFPPVSYGGRRIPIAQCNNVYIFPAMGLGIVASGARKVTEPMLLAAARALGANSPALKDPSASLLPVLTEIRRVTAEIAVAVGIEAQKDGVAPKVSEEELRRSVAKTQWTLAYASVPKEEHR